MTPVILPPAAGSAASPVASTSHTAVLATVPDAPPAAARLEAGSIVTGTVLGRDAQGLVTIRTDKGLLALATHAQLPVGSTVALEVRVAGARLQLVILSVEPPPGETAHLNPATLASGGTAGAPSAAATPAATPAATLAAALGGGSLVMATVVHATIQSTLPAAAAGRPTTAPAAGQAPAGGQAGSPGGPTAAGGRAASTPAPTPAGGSGLPGQIAGATAPAGQSVGDQLLALQLAAEGIGTTPATPAGPAASPSPGGPATNASAGATPGQPAPASPPTPGSATAATAGAAAAPPAAGPTPPAAPAAGLGPAIQGDPALPPSAAPPANPAIAPAPARPLPATAASTLIPGTEIGVRILAAALPGEPTPTAGARPPGAPPPTAALVIGQTPSSHPIVDTPAGRLILAVKAALPAGTALLLELPMPGQGPLPAPGATIASPFLALLKLARGWPALGEALATLATTGEAAAAQALAARLPSAGPGLAAGILAMIDQFAAGKSGEWLGPALREALARGGRRDLADRLQNEFRQIARMAGETAGGDWRVMFLPLHDGRELHQVNLYLRHRQHAPSDETADTGTRFVVEVDMTRLGPIQLDGLVHGRRFDLMLRSRVPLSPGMRRDIEAIFEEARGIGGYAGSIGFQVAASFPVQPLEQAQRQTPASAVVV